ncbi:hypothetical protein [Paenibacillus polysaccharolyticus]|nr:hypothetical protein [Paenibacillus intestini]
MSTEKSQLQCGFQSMETSVVTMIFHMSVYAESFIDKDRHYPLG